MTIDFPPKVGGVARYLDQLATHFRDEIVVVAPPMVGSEEVDSVAGYRIVRRSLLGFTLWPKWLDAVRTLIELRATYDTVITSHVIPIGVAARLAKIVTGKPYVVIVHGLDISLAKRHVWKYWLATFAMRGAKVVIANSYALKEEIARDYGVRQSMVVYPCAAPVTENRERVDSETFHLLTVSRLIERKGHVRVLEALAKLKAKNQLGTLRYTIVGDGPMLGQLQERVRELGLVEIVVFRENVDDDTLQQIYQASDLFVMPTLVLGAFDREGFGMVYLEAAQYGIPSIASDLPGPDEAVLHGKTGFLVKDGDIDMLSEAIHRFMTDRELRERVGAAAKARVGKEFRPEYQFTKLEAIL